MSRANFGQMFMHSKGAPIDYHGKQLIMLDRVPVKLGDRLLLTIESTRAEWPQGVGISEGPFTTWPSSRAAKSGGTGGPRWSPRILRGAAGTRATTSNWTTTSTTW